MSGESPALILRARNTRQVDYLMVGGLVAVAAWAYERATKDTDVLVPSPDSGNDQRLQGALADLSAEPDAGGLLDVMSHAESAAPYPQLRERATTFSTSGVPAAYVGREDLIAMKLAAGRLQDMLTSTPCCTRPTNRPAARSHARRPRAAARRRRAARRSRTRGPRRTGGRPTAPRARGQHPPPTSSSGPLAARARELRQADHDSLTELARRPAPQLPGELTRAPSSLQLPPASSSWSRLRRPRSCTGAITPRRCNAVPGASSHAS